MSADTLLAQLDKTRKTGAGSWIACCPSHQDKNPSMTIREVEDGRVLVHCFAGCSVESILGAVGLEFDALFPPKPIEHAPRLRRPFPAADVLEAVFRDALLVQQIAAEMERTGTVTADQRKSLSGAGARIAAAERLVNG